MDNLNTEEMNQFENQENQDINNTQNDLTPQTPSMEHPDNEMNVENNGNNLNSQGQKNSSNENSEENDENKKKKGTRRSKRESEGRNYVCKMCSKSYLSYPALYTHYKQKHNTNNWAPIQIYSIRNSGGRIQQLVFQQTLQVILISIQA